ncbi:MAG: tyrosine-type recombinase/integrase [Myxococcales bacterium]
MQGAGCRFQEMRADPGEDRCPRCRMRLWVSPLPRKLRFYDLRRAHATLLRKAGVDLGAVQRALGHSSPEITAAVYDHSDLEDYRADVERALSFARPREVNAPVMQIAGTEKKGRPRADRKPDRTRGLQTVGAIGFEPATTCTPSGLASRATVIGSSQLFGFLRLIITTRRPRLTGSERDSQEFCYQFATTDRAAPHRPAGSAATRCLQGHSLQVGR